MKKLFAIILSLGLIMAPIPSVNTAHASGGGGYMKILLGMSNGIVGSTILMKCTMGASQPSLLLYMAGSLVYAAAEILGGKNKQKAVGMNAEQLDQLKATMKEGGDYQRAALEGQLKNEEDNLKHVQKKLQWMNATKIVYTLAAIVAIIEWILHFPPPPAGIGILKTDVGGCVPNPATNIPMETAIVAAYSILQAYASSGASGALMAGGMGALKSFAPQIAEKLGIVKVMDTVQEMTISALNSGLGRAAWFGAAALVVTKLTSELQSEASKIRERISKIKAILAQMSGASNNLAEGSTESTSGAGDGNDKIDPATGKKYAIKSLPKSNEVGKHCFTASGKGMDYSEAGCKSAYKIAKPKMEGQFNIPTISAGTNSTVDMANAIASGDLAAAEVEAGKLTSMAGRIDAIHNELKKKADEQLKKMGKKPLDYNAEVARQVASYNDALNKNNPGSGNFSMAEFESTGVGAASISDSAPVDGAGEVAAAGVNGAPEVAAPGVDLSKIEDAAAAAGEGVLDPNAADPNKLASLSDGLNGFESNEGDISKDRDVSIFKQVSNRYFLNYTRLFEKKKVEPPMAEPAPTP